MIEIKNAGKSFADFTALDDVTVSIKPGTAFGLIGSNGAGKSTLLRLIAGIYQSDSGSVQLDGKDIYDNEEAKRRVFFINDETVQFAGMSLKDMKNFYSGFYPNFSNELFEKLLDAIKLPLNKRTDKFSKGMKRQAAVITGLACRTDYILLDEAFDGLDPTMRNIVKRMLVDEMIDRQVTAVISSHNMKEIGEICDTAALLHKGKVIFSRELDSLNSDIHKIQAVFPSEVTEKDFDGLNILHFDRQHSMTYMIIRSSEEDIRAVLGAKKPLALDIIPLTLEEVFIYEMEGQGYDYRSIC